MVDLYKEFKKALLTIKAPEVLDYVYNNRNSIESIEDSVYLHVIDEKIFEKLRKNSEISEIFAHFLAGVLIQEEFSKAFSDIHKIYPNMTEKELVFCLCLQNCQEEDFEKYLKNPITKEQVHTILSLHDKYHNDLTDKVLNVVLKEKTREWFLKLRSYIAEDLQQDEKDIEFGPSYQVTYYSKEDKWYDDIAYYEIEYNFDIKGIESDNLPRILDEFFYVFEGYDYVNEYTTAEIDINNDNEKKTTHITIYEKYTIRPENTQNQDLNLSL